jgi:SnoaL-like domain
MDPEARMVRSIKQVIRAYSDAVSVGDVAGAAKLFSPQASLELPGLSPAIGPLNIEELLGTTLRSVGKVVQVPVDMDVDVLDDARAVAMVRVIEIAKSDDGSERILVGRYSDQFERVEGWRFATRRLDLQHRGLLLERVRDVVDGLDHD